MSDNVGDLGQQMLRFNCARCNRAGRYRADRLLGLVGDIHQAMMAETIAAHGGCERAKHPPDVGDIATYNDKRCQNRWLRPKAVAVPFLATVLHEGWRVFVICQRHHQGLKSVKPCRGARELEVATMAATLGHDLPIDQVKERIVAPCCGSQQFIVEWLLPDGSRR